MVEGSSRRHHHHHSPAANVGVQSIEAIVNVLEGASYDSVKAWAEDPRRWLGVHWIFSFLHPLVGGIMLVPIAIFTSSLMTLFCRLVQRLSKIGSARHQAATAS